MQVLLWPVQCKALQYNAMQCSAHPFWSMQGCAVQQHAMHCGTSCIIQAKEVPNVKDEIIFESQPPPKPPFLTVISKINSPTKIEMLGTWQTSYFFKNVWPFFFVLYRGALG